MSVREAGAELGAAYRKGGRIREAAIILVEMECKEVGARFRNTEDGWGQRNISVAKLGERG